MKKLLFSLTAFVCSTALFAQTSDVKAADVAAQPGKKAADVARFDLESVDLGKVKQDNPATAIFTVTNISNEPLIIEQANPTCGCTISDYTKSPIAPGKTGTIKATYNAKNVGPIDKHLTVKFAGVEEIKNIGIKGEVLTPDAFAKLNPGAAVDNGSIKASTETKTTVTSTQVKTEGKRPAPKKVVTKKMTTATSKS